MSEFDKLVGDAEQEAKDHPQQVHEAEQDAEHAVENKIGDGSGQNQGDASDQSARPSPRPRHKTKTKATRITISKASGGRSGMAEDLLPSDPESVGPYRLIRRLGTGGMGQVYLASSPGGRLVAVKVIRPELAADPGFRSRFAREVRAARSVSGMFTAPVVDADADGQPPWLATAYVPGPSLRDAVAEHGPLPPDVVLTLAAGLAEALVAIHAAGLVHRDLKPSNVLLAGDGPRVIDFGISQAADASVLTQTGAIMGSPGYFSPEQAEGRPVGPPGDVFSLGAVLAFAASGEGPFGTGPAVALAFRVVNSAPNLSGVPEQLRPMIERCLVKDPAARPTPAELLASLAAGHAEPQWPSRRCDGAEPAAGPDTYARPAPKPRRSGARPLRPGQ